MLPLVCNPLCTPGLRLATLDIDTVHMRAIIHSRLNDRLYMCTSADTPHSTLDKTPRTNSLLLQHPARRQPYVQSACPGRSREHLTALANLPLDIKHCCHLSPLWILHRPVTNRTAQHAHHCPPKPLSPPISQPSSHASPPAAPLKPPASRGPTDRRHTPVQPQESIYTTAHTRAPTAVTAAYMRQDMRRQ